jgi:hypothetical protein
MVQLIERLISPAVMISATGLLLLSVNHRTGRITDRIREILDELRSVEEDSSRQASLIRQLKSLRYRGRLAQNSVLSFLVGVLLFVLTAGGLIVELVGGVLSYLPIISFYGGLVALLVGLGFYLVEIRESFRISRIELDYWLEG